MARGDSGTHLRDVRITGCNHKKQEGGKTMNANGFREDELVTRKIKVNGQWETRTFPVVGGRLRLAHEQNDKINLKTKLVAWDGQYAVFKCCAVTGKGRVVGYGTANNQRDSRLAESLVELAETRSIARALRFAGFGLEFTGAEEVSHVAVTESETEQTTVFVEATQSNKEETKSGGNGNGEAGAPNGAAVIEKTMPQSCGNGRATQAQCRALFALTKKARYAEVDINNLLVPFKASTFQDLSREDASRLISALQTKVAA
jgi:hypothetical protein